MLMRFLNVSYLIGCGGDVCKARVDMRKACVDARKVCADA